MANLTCECYYVISISMLYVKWKGFDKGPTSSPNIYCQDLHTNYMMIATLYCKQGQGQRQKQVYLLFADELKKPTISIGNLQFGPLETFP